MDALEEVMEPDRVRFAGVRSPEEHDVGVFRLFVRAGAAPRSENCRQTDDAGSVSGPVTTVDVVVAEHHARELGRGEVHFVARLGTAENAERVAAVRGDVARESLGGAIQRLVPTRATQHAVLAHERVREPGVAAAFGRSWTIDHLALLRRY